MNIDPNRFTRASASVTQMTIRGGTSAVPKKSFGQMLSPPAGVSGAQQHRFSPAELLTMLDSVHQKIRASSNATQLADLLDEYIALTARLAMSLGPAAPFLPGGAVLTAAVNAAPGSRP